MPGKSIAKRESGVERGMEVALSILKARAPPPPPLSSLCSPLAPPAAPRRAANRQLRRPPRRRAPSRARSLPGPCFCSPRFAAAADSPRRPSPSLSLYARSTRPQPLVHYGFIPAVIAIGMLTTKPRPTLFQLLSPIG